MLKILQLYYLAVACALFLYALYTPRHGLRSFLLAMAANAFPLAWLPYMSMDGARLGGLPLVYLPATAVGLALTLRNGFHLPRRHLSLYALICVYLIYTFANTVLFRGISASNLVYWLAWPLNFLMFIAMASLAARMQRPFLDRMLHAIVLLLVAASLVGLIRFASGLNADANFIPLMNRNGTVVLISLLFPLIFHVHATQRKSGLWLFTCTSIVALCVVLTFSRSGLVGLLAGVILYYWRFSLMGLLKLSAAVVVLALFLSSGIAERSTERLLMTGNTISSVLDGSEIDRSVGDHNRVALMNSAIATAKEHIWFGTGLGMTNYRKGMNKSSTAAVTSKSHNFYLSYFTELGVIGFALLLAIFHRIYASLPSLSSPSRAFRVSFLVMAIMMTMNEYILLPELWLMMGLLIGITHPEPAARRRAGRNFHTLGTPGLV